MTLAGEDDEVTPAGWYRQPEDPDQLRWWDGDDWTDDTMPVPDTASQRSPGSRSARPAKKAAPAAQAAKPRRTRADVMAAAEAEARGEVPMPEPEPEAQPAPEPEEPAAPATPVARARPRKAAPVAIELEAAPDQPRPRQARSPQPQKAQPAAQRPPQRKPRPQQPQAPERTTPETVRVLVPEAAGDDEDWAAGAWAALAEADEAPAPERPRQRAPRPHPGGPVPGQRTTRPRPQGGPGPRPQVAQRPPGAQRPAGPARGPQPRPRDPADDHQPRRMAGGAPSPGAASAVRLLVRAGIIAVVLAIGWVGYTQLRDAKPSDARTLSDEPAAVTVDPDAARLDQIILTLADLPRGWSSQARNPSNGDLCEGRVPESVIEPTASQTGVFTFEQSGAVIGNTVWEFPNDDIAGKYLDLVAEVLDSCREQATEGNTTNLTPIEFPSFGDESFVAGLTSEGANGSVHGILVYVRHHNRVASVVNLTPGSVGLDTELVEHLVDLVNRRMGSKPEISSQLPGSTDGSGGGELPDG